MKSTRLVFDALRNTRDLGGMVGTDGRRIKSGMLIRSGQLFEASENDKKKLSELVSTIIDFRTDEEASQQPDPEINGTEYRHCSVLQSLTAGISWEENSTEADFEKLAKDAEGSYNYMKSIYSAFPVSDAALDAYRLFVRTLLSDNDKAVLWHCTAGKDRAGFASVLTEYILGVSWEDIKEDYLYTNECIAEDMETLKKLFFNDDDFSEQAVIYLFSAQEGYLDSLITTIYEKYGSFDGFIREGLGLSDEDMAALRAKYLE